MKFIESLLVLKILYMQWIDYLFFPLLLKKYLLNFNHWYMQFIFSATLVKIDKNIIL